MIKYAEDIMRAVNSFYTCIIIGRCSIEYKGRITSSLEEGDRIIIIKSDHSVVVHKPRGVMPINYMKEKSNIIVDYDDIISINILSIKNKESMSIVFSTIKDVRSYPMVDDNQIQLYGTENDMSDMIMKNPKLIDDDFVPLSREEHTRFGFIDVYGHDSNRNLVVVECKRVQADYNAIVQLKRYVDRIMKSKGINDYNRIRGIIAAPSITSRAEEYMRPLGFEYRKVNPPERMVREKSQSSLDTYY
ncbi:MAG: endonuclease NucS [Candidatus Woesearchaeota archaeon]